MNKILYIYTDQYSINKSTYMANLQHKLGQCGFKNLISSNFEKSIGDLKRDPRIHCVILDWECYSIKTFSQLAAYNPEVPVFAMGDHEHNIVLSLEDFQINLDFLQFDDRLLDDHCQRICSAISQYQKKVLPPFTYQLMQYAKENNNSFCTPGHQAGHGFQRGPAGALFYDFYGPNLFKSDISVSMTKLGSLLDHSGFHEEAETFIANAFNADRSLIVTNGTSTSNKIVGMYAVADGDTILVDRNCHKSVAHLLMMIDANPIYLKPQRNAHGILGGIPKAEFLKENIQEKLNKHPVAKSWPTYAVITNSTYDGLFYNVDFIAKNINVKTLHFDSAWVPYAAFHPIYDGKYGLSAERNPDQTIIETQSTHKLLSAFSQASMIHVKGEYDTERLHEAFMMHTSTSPFYPLVASCEISAAMLTGKIGLHLISDVIGNAINFRNEIIKFRKKSSSWFYDVWQPTNINKIEAWSLHPNDKWHGFQQLDSDHLYLDPIKVTLLLPGIENSELQSEGIPAAVVAAFLADNGIIVEKTGPYCLLFLFSMGITRAKSMRLLAVLNKFKQMYDSNLSVKEVLPSIYMEHPNFYAGKKIQEIAQTLHKVICKHNLPHVMYHAFNQLPEFVMNPHKAYQKFIKNQTEKILLSDLVGETSAVMVLPYPPGIPLIMPGEKITESSNIILEFLLMLEDIGKQLPGFDIEIHGVKKEADNQLYLSVIKE